MKKAGIIIIGNEVLSGRTLDKNSNFICSRCSELGIKVEEILVIGDIKKTIIKNVLNSSKKYTYVFVTGGIGPTHDDITAESIAEAFNKKLTINEKAKKLLKKHYSKSNLELNESRMKMAKTPLNSNLIINPVSAAPGFKIKNVWVMAGVPKIMQAMFVNGVEPKLKKEKPFSVREIVVFQAEGEIAVALNKFQLNFKNLDVGSYPFYSPPKIGTSIIIRGKDEQLLNKAASRFCNILEEKKIKFNLKK